MLSQNGLFLGHVAHGVTVDWAQVQRAMVHATYFERMLLTAGRGEHDMHAIKRDALGTAQVMAQQTQPLER